MPLYEYICRTCNTDFEALVSASRRDGDIPCPKCGEVKVARKISLMAQPVVKGGNGGNNSAEQFSCGAPQCCGGGCAID
jgi:putative FmdB family regulatory protein